MKKVMLLLVILSCISVFSVNYGLLIANSSYFSDASVKSLPADSMISNLKSAIISSGYIDEKNINVIMNGSKEIIINSLEEISGRAAEGDNIFVYYAGFRMKAEKDFYYSTSDNPAVILKTNPLMSKDFKSIFSSKTGKINIIFDLFDIDNKDTSPVINSEVSGANCLLITSVSQYFSETNTGLNSRLVSLFGSNKNNKEIQFGLADNIKKPALFTPEITNPVSDKKYGLSTTLEWKTNASKDDRIKYDLYFGTDKEPVLYASNLATPSFQLKSKSLNFDSQYYIKVVSKDNFGNAFASDTKSFKTTSDLGVLKVCAGMTAPLAVSALLYLTSDYIELNPLTYGCAIGGLVLSPSIAITCISAANGENTNIFATGAGYLLGSLISGIIISPLSTSIALTNNQSGMYLLSVLIFLGGSIGATMLSSY